MQVRVTKDFKFAEDGIHVRSIRAGEVLTGRGAVVALQLKVGEELHEEKAAPSVENKAEEAAPLNKATITAAPNKKKGR